MEEKELAGILKLQTDAIAAMRAELEETRKELRKVTNALKRSAAELETLKRVVADGEQVEYPWFRLPPARRQQVDSVFQFICSHPTRTIQQAVIATWKGTSPGGYPTKESLMCYCYSHRIATYRR